MFCEKSIRLARNEEICGGGGGDNRGEGEHVARAVNKKARGLREGMYYRSSISMYLCFFIC